METSRSRGRILDNTEPVRQTAGEERRHFSVLHVNEELFVQDFLCHIFSSLFQNLLGNFTARKQNICLTSFTQFSCLIHDLYACTVSIISHTVCIHIDRPCCNSAHFALRIPSPRSQWTFSPALTTSIPSAVLIGLPWRTVGRVSTAPPQACVRTALGTGPQ